MVTLLTDRKNMNHYTKYNSDNNGLTQLFWDKQRTHSIMGQPIIAAIVEQLKYNESIYLLYINV